MHSGSLDKALADKVQAAANAASRKMRAASVMSGTPDAEFALSVRIFGAHVHMEFHPGASSMNARMLSVALAKWADMRDAEQSQSHNGIILP